jgi:hypothetical protein
MKYEFDPTKYGFLPPDRIPAPLKEYLGKGSFVKVIAVSPDGSFWYTSAWKYGGSDDRWVFTGGLYDTKRAEAYNEGHTSHRDYSGCITSKEFAEQLLIHILGTTTNEGTLKYGAERLAAPSLKIPRKKASKPTA